MRFPEYHCYQCQLALVLTGNTPASRDAWCCAAWLSAVSERLWLHLLCCKPIVLGTRVLLQLSRSWDPEDFWGMSECWRSLYAVTRSIYIRLRFLLMVRSVCVGKLLFRPSTICAGLFQYCHGAGLRRSSDRNWFDQSSIARLCGSKHLHGTC